jgi:hypothetical protein
VKVYFHGNSQFLDLSGRLGHKVYLGRHYESQITIQDALQIEYKNVHNGIVFYDSDQKCSKERYDKCMYDTLRSAMQTETEDNCTAPWLSGNLQICTKPRDIKKVFWIAWNRITNQKRDCLKPCHTTLITVGGKNVQKQEDKPKEGHLVAYFSSNIAQSREQYFITVIKLAGQIGGYIGLFRLSLTLLNLIKFNKLVDGVFVNKKSDKIVQAEPVDRYNENGNDALIGLSTLAINNPPLRVS